MMSVSGHSCDMTGGENRCCARSVPQTTASARSSGLVPFKSVRSCHGSFAAQIVSAELSAQKYQRKTLSAHLSAQNPERKTLGAKPSAQNPQRKFLGAKLSAQTDSAEL